MFLLFLHLKNGDTIEKDGRLIVDYPLNDLNGAMHLYPVYIHTHIYIYIVYVGEDHIIHQLGPPMNQAGFYGNGTYWRFDPTMEIFAILRPIIPLKHPLNIVLDVFKCLKCVTLW